jgi:hypothetical protein
MLVGSARVNVSVFLVFLTLEIADRGLVQLGRGDGQQHQGEADPAGRRADLEVGPPIRL